MIEARDIACSILEMSSEDLDALMEDDDHEVHGVSKRCSMFDKILKNNNKRTVLWEDYPVSKILK